MYEELKKYKIFWQYPVITEKTFIYKIKRIQYMQEYRGQQY